MSKNKIKERMAQVKAFRRAANRFSKVCDEWKVKIDDRVEFLRDIADELADSDEIVEQVARREKFCLSSDTQVGPMILDHLELCAKWMAESAEELASLAKEAREEKSRLMVIFE